MFGILFSKEIREHLMTFRFSAALITTFVLVIVSIWVLGEDYVRRRDLYNSVTDQCSAEVTQAWTPALIKPSVWYPPFPLGIFAMGEERRFGNFVRIQRWLVPERATEGLSNNEFLESLPSFDLLAVFTVVVSLFGILFSYDSISGERERGTLKLLSMGKINRPTMFAVKFLAINAILAIPFLFSFTAALVALQFVFNVAFSGSQWMAIGMMVLTGLTSGALFVAVGILCSSLSLRSSTSLVMALFFWTLSIIIVPLIGTRIAETIVPTRSTTEIRQLSSRLREEISAKLRELYFTADTQVNFFVVARLGSDPAMYDGNEAAFRFLIHCTNYLEPFAQEKAEILGKLIIEHENRRAEQAKLAGLLSSASPAQSLREAFTALAGTDFKSYSRFITAARRYRTMFLRNLREKGLFSYNAVQFFSRWTMDDIDEEKCLARRQQYDSRPSDWYDRTTTRNWDEIAPLPEGLVPPFVFESDKPDIEAATQQLGLLAAVTVIAFALGIVAFTRYDIR